VNRAIVGFPSANSLANTIKNLKAPKCLDASQEFCEDFTRILLAPPAAFGTRQDLPTCTFQK
jgi:hypothetical protein